MRVQNRGTTVKSVIKLAAALGVFAVLGCSNEASLNAIPSDHPLEKVKNSDQTVSFNPSVDILFVVDDSGSMASHQANLSKNIKQFTQAIAGVQFLDYHIGVVTTSMDNQSPNAPSGPWGGDPCDSSSAGRACGDGRLVYYKTKTRFVDRNTKNGLDILEQNLVVGTDGSAKEEIFAPVQAALSSPVESTENAGFLRPDASLAVIFVTDAEDQSDNLNAQELYDFLLRLKGGRAEKIIAYGALVPSSVSNPQCARDQGDAPVKIEDFLKLAKGIEYNICDQDYGTKLANIAADVIQKVGRIMFLSRPPVVDTISVTYGTQVIPNDVDKGWTYDPERNALLFGKGIVLTVQAPGTQLEVNFTAGTY